MKMRAQLSFIFGLFDSADNNMISSDLIDVDNVPIKILELFKPLIDEMERFNACLDVDEFIESSLVLLQRYTVDKRNFILNLNRVYKKTPEPSFAPQICKVSKRLAQKAYSKVNLGS